MNNIIKRNYFIIYIYIKSRYRGYNITFKKLTNNYF